MKRVLLVAFVLAAFAVPAMAGTYVHDSQFTSLTEPKAGDANVPFAAGVLNPFNAACVPQIFELIPGDKPAVDPLTGKAIVDENGCQARDLTWFSYMSATGVVKTYQSAELVKIHPIRKFVCGLDWCADPIRQNGPAGINLKWPLLFETDGTVFMLTVRYQTNLAVNPFFPSGKKSITHKEIWIWRVKADTWANLECRVNTFRVLPAGMCELSMITSDKIVKRINYYENGNLNCVVNVQDTFAGIKSLLTTDRAAAGDAFLALESYIGSLCWSGCECRTAPDPCAPAPAPDFLGIINKCDAPGANVLINDVWAIARVNGFTDK